MKKLILIMILFSSCATSKVKNISTPTKREIKKAMKYSTSEYRMPITNIYSTSY